MKFFIEGDENSCSHQARRHSLFMILLFEIIIMERIVVVILYLRLENGQINFLIVAFLNGTKHSAVLI